MAISFNCPTLASFNPYIREPSKPTFAEWFAPNSSDLWAEYRESGAYRDTDYADWLAAKYAAVLPK
jgi:hypothetical protein